MGGTALRLLIAFALFGVGVALANDTFEAISVRFEQNVSDGDAEIVFEATSGSAGLNELKVLTPDGRTIIDFKAPQTKLGIRHLNLESPEPKDLTALKGDFPAGDYRFIGTTVTGARLAGTATLSYRMPAVVSVSRPRPDEVGLPPRGFEIRWTGDRDLASHSVSIEDERSGVKLLQATLPGNAQAFVVPDRFLRAGTKYKVSIGALMAGGNASFVESTFTTAGK